MTAAAGPLGRPTLDALRQRTSLKWQLHPGDVLPLWVAEMDVEPADAVVVAVTDAMRAGDTGYPVGTSYAEALRDFASDRWGFDGVDVGRTSLVPDVMVGLTEVLALLTAPGDAIVVNPPVYPPFYSFAEHSGRRVIEAPLDANFRLDLDALDAAFAEARAGGRPAAYLMCSPHNPTGTVHTRAELELVAALADKHGVRVVTDEIHGPLVLPGATFVPYLAVDDSAITLTSASKAFNLAGFKAALAIAGPRAADDLARLPEVVLHGVSHFGVIAHTAALRGARDWLDEVVVALDANRALLDTLVAERLPGVSWQPPEATYLAWLDCRALGLSEGDESDPAARGNVLSLAGPALFFLEKARVALSAGPAFGTGGDGHVRLNFATSPAVLAEAIDRMASALA